MSLTKNALLRYLTLDRCFRNSGRSYNFEDLLSEVNTALMEDDPTSSGINIRQLRSDIQFMRSEVGYAAPIVSEIYSGKKHSYFYSDPSFSINNSPSIYFYLIGSYGNNLKILHFLLILSKFVDCSI